MKGKIEITLNGGRVSIFVKHIACYWEEMIQTRWESIREVKLHIETVNGEFIVNDTYDEITQKIAGAME